MQKKNITKILMTVLTIICFIIAIYIYSKEKLEGYELLWILPVTFGISNILFNFLNSKYCNGIGTYTLFFMMILKYVVTPFTIVLTGNYYGTSINYGVQPNSENINFAIWMLVYECITIFIVNKVYKMKLYKKEKCINTKEIVDPQTDSRRKYRTLIIWGVIFLLIILPYIPSLISNNFLIITEDVIQNNIIGEHSGVYSIIYFFAKAFLFVGIVEYIIKKYNNNSKLIAILYIIISCIYLGLNTGTSRWAILIPVIQMIYIAIRIFPSNKKMIILTLSILAVISITSITLYKFEIDVREDENNFIEAVKELSESMESYLSGPRNVALAIEMNEIYGENITLSTVINSAFSSVPYVSNFINVQDRFAKYYNDYIFGQNKWEDQIIPSIGEGFAIFGLIGCNIFTIIYIILLIYIDNKLKKEKDIKYLFAYSYIGIRLATSLGLNIAIVMSSILGKIIPLIILFKFIDKINGKNKYD